MSENCSKYCVFFFALSSWRLTHLRVISFGAFIPDLPTMPPQKDTTLDIPPKPEYKTDENPPNYIQSLLHLATAPNTRFNTLTTNIVNLISIITTAWP